MKNFLALMFVIMIASSCSNTPNEPATMKNEQTPKTLSTTLKQVVSIHELELKQGVNPIEFEKYMNTIVAPLYDQIKGQHFQLVKGDRGNRTNKYSVILSFDSIEDRNRIYPLSGDSPEDWGNDKVWEKLSAMATGLGEELSYTDYIEIVK